MLQFLLRCRCRACFRKCALCPSMRCGDILRRQRRIPNDRSAGLRDPFVGRTLALLYGQLTYPWTLDALAHEVGLLSSSEPSSTTCAPTHAYARSNSRSSAASVAWIWSTASL